MKVGRQVFWSMALLGFSADALAGRRDDADQAARQALQEASERGPAVSASEIKPLARLLEKAGWEPTPELSGVFQPGAIFQVTGASHALVARAEDCVAASPQENPYTSADLVSSMQAGVSVTAGAGSAGIGGQSVKTVRFGAPVQSSLPILDLRLEPDCIEKLRLLSEEQRAASYVVREVLRAVIAEETSGQLNAEGRVVGLGGADAGYAASSNQSSLEPVAVGYRKVPLDDLLAAVPVANITGPVVATPSNASSAPAESAAAELPEEAIPEPDSTESTPKAEPLEAQPTGQLVLVFSQEEDACAWTVDDLATGRSADLFASSQCPSELFWSGTEELFFDDGGTYYSLRAGHLRAEPLTRPEHAICTGDDSWLAPRMDPRSGIIHWACWAEAETVEENPGDGGLRVCIGDLCSEDDGYHGFGTPQLFIDFALDSDGGWTQDGTYSDCYETEGCGYTTTFGPLSTSAPLPEGMFSLSTIRSAHIRRATYCEDMPEELRDDPSLMSLMGIDSSPLDLESGFYCETSCEAWIEGSPLEGEGFLLWTRVSEQLGAFGPVVVCDKSCRRRQRLDFGAWGGLQIELAGPWAVIAPDSEGRTVLVNGVTQGIERTWSTNQQVLVLPSGVPAPLGVQP